MWCTDSDVIYISTQQQQQQSHSFSLCVYFMYIKESTEYWRPWKVMVLRRTSDCQIYLYMCNFFFCFVWFLLLYNVHTTCPPSAVASSTTNVCTTRTQNTHRHRRPLYSQWTLRPTQLDPISVQLDFHRQTHQQNSWAKRILSQIIVAVIKRFSEIWIWNDNPRVRRSIQKR